MASKTSSAPADEVGLSVRPRSGFHPERRTGGVNTACTQPGCTGTILDGYCDLCDSPGALPFVPAAVEAQRTDGEKGLADDGPDDAKDYRTRVEKAQLPDDVREAALREVGKLERTRDEDHESDDIRAWLDTILELPWSTKPADWIDVQASREVEATLRTLIEPGVADKDEADAGKVESETADIQQTDAGKVQPKTTDIQQTDDAKPDRVAAAIENAHRAAAERHHDDTVETSAVLAVPSGGRHPQPELTEQQLVGPALVHSPVQKRRFGSLALVATALVALLIGAFVFAASRDGSVKAVSAPTVTTTATVTDEPTIQLEDLADSARPLETVRIQGAYRGGKDTLLRVQRKEGGNWVDFPLPSKTDKSGQFKAYVEFGQPGIYRLRLVDPNSGVTSKTFVLRITG